MFTKLDRWLIDNVFQPVVDWSERQPSWWFMQCGYAIAVSSLADLAVGLETATTADMFATVAGLVLGALWVFYGRLSAFVAYVGADARLRWFMGVACVLVSISNVAEMEPDTVLEVLHSLSVASSYFFAACRPPQPRFKGRFAFNV